MREKRQSKKDDRGILTPRDSLDALHKAKALRERLTDILAKDDIRND
jgi:hypothetical protein